MENKYQILLYYKYVTIENPKKERDFQFDLCQSLGLKGRIIVAKEGINGTVEGTIENTEKYIETLKENPIFSDMSFKKSIGIGDAFPRLSVKLRDEIVSLHLKNDINPNEITGKRIKAEDLKKWYEEGREFYIVDMRNDYEYKVGHFKNSLFLPIENFREIPNHLDKISHLKNKTVVPVCTGGVRCEKASGFLMREGFKDVYQIEDGMVSYIENFPEQEFLGSLYVFDKRITYTKDSSLRHIVVGKCDLCEEKTERFVNCSNKNCNRKMLCCDSCFEKSDGADVFCSAICRDFVRNKNKEKEEVLIK